VPGFARLPGWLRGGRSAAALAPIEDSAPLSGSPREGCRNCATVFVGNFCPACGQEADTRMPGVWAFLFEMFTHHVGSEGKLPRTLWRLFARPGALTADYFAGIRARYIRPVRLYLIASVAFFVVGGVLTQHLATPIHIDNAVKIEIARESKDLRSEWEEQLVKRVRQWTQLPEAVRTEVLVKSAFDYAPKVMFMLLPLFALLTFLLYWNRRRPYVAHLVFALHWHALVFFTALLALCVRWQPLVLLLVLYVLVCLPLALRRAFGGRALATLLRVIVLLVLQALAQAVAVLALVLAVLAL